MRDCGCGIAAGLLSHVRGAFGSFSLAPERSSSRFFLSRVAELGHRQDDSKDLRNTITAIIALLKFTRVRSSFPLERNVATERFICNLQQ